MTRLKTQNPFRHPVFIKLPSSDEDGRRTRRNWSWFQSFLFSWQSQLFFNSTQKEGCRLYWTFRTQHMTAKDKVKLVRWLVNLNVPLCTFLPFLLFCLLPSFKQMFLYIFLSAFEFLNNWTSTMHREICF